MMIDINEEINNSTQGRNLGQTSCWVKEKLSILYDSLHMKFKTQANLIHVKRNQKMVADSDSD